MSWPADYGHSERIGTPFNLGTLSSLFSWLSVSSIQIQMWSWRRSRLESPFKTVTLYLVQG